MGVHRKGIHRHHAGRMHGIRKGGKVSLFNYNPSIAGGAIGLRRFDKQHHLGVPCRNWQQKHMAAMVGAAEGGGGLHAPGSGARMGMGGKVGDRKRVLDMVKEQLNKRLKM